MTPSFVPLILPKSIDFSTSFQVAPVEWSHPKQKGRPFCETEPASGPGEETKDDTKAVAALILDNADATCTAAPALIFYNA